jgi:hypothetical protein
MYKIIVVLIGTFVWSNEMAEDKVYEVADVYLGLRNQVLTLDAKTLGVDAPVFSVLMETGYPEAVATVIAVADGTSSVYFSNGGGIIGAGEYKQVHDAAIKFISVAEKNIEKMSISKDYPLPKKGFTRFYVVTSAGVYSFEALEDDLGNKRSELSNLFFQGHEFMSYIRTADEHRRAEQGTPADR